MPAISLRFRCLRHRLRHNDEGALLVVAILVASVALSLGLLVTSQAIITSGDSGRDRQRTGQVHAAEAGVDSAYYQLQLGAVPCALPVVNIGDRPDITEVRTTVAYYNAGGLLPCVAGVATGTPTKAVISAIASSTNRVSPGAPTTRTMESEVLLSPSAGGNGYAIFSGSSLAITNFFNLTGNPVSPPDIYLRGDFLCSNSGTLGGSVFSASGNVQLSNSCVIRGGLSARGRIYMANSARVDVKVSSSRSDLVLSNTASVGGDVRLRGTYSGDRSRITGTLTTGDAGIPDPIDQSLPWIGYDPSAWTAAGFTVDPPTSDCAAVKARMFVVTTPTVFYADCPLEWYGNNSGLRLKTDVALFVPKGMTISNNFGMASNTAQARKLWVISPPKNQTAAKPAGWTAADCDGGNISFSNLTAFASSINLFLYTCKTVYASNSSTFTGQIYGQQVYVANSFTMAFVGLPPVGVDLGGAPALPGFRVQVLYKRET